LNKSPVSFTAIYKKLFDKNGICETATNTTSSQYYQTPIMLLGRLRPSSRQKIIQTRPMRHMYACLLEMGIESNTEGSGSTQFGLSQGKG